MILLTGGSGYIGSAIWKHLRSLGREVDAPPTHHLNVLDDKGVQDYVRGKTYEAMILAHGHYGHVGKIKESRLELWMRGVELGLFGCYSLMHYADVTGQIIVFGGARGGRIPLPERSAYAAAKAALNSLVLTGASEGLKIYGVAPGPQPSKHVKWLLQNSSASNAVKAEVGESVNHSSGLRPVLSIIDELLAGKGEAGHFYSARGL